MTRSVTTHGVARRLAALASAALVTLLVTSCGIEPAPYAQVEIRTHAGADRSNTSERRIEVIWRIDDSEHDAFLVFDHRRVGHTHQAPEPPDAAVVTLTPHAPTVTLFVPTGTYTIEAHAIDQDQHVGSARDEQRRIEPGTTTIELTFEANPAHTLAPDRRTSTPHGMR